MRIVLSIVLIAVPLFAQQPEEQPFSEAQAMMQETMQTVSPQDSLVVENSYNDNLSPQQRFEESPKHNVHEYDYKQQAIVGGAVMFCVALAMIMNNNYNPKRGK
ncbi:MAG: hypothetical protein FWC26_15340 [Fibromonadales bacterium]|nr:hypothetical protein [Fibromonadales bacterium]